MLKDKELWLRIKGTLEYRLVTFVIRDTFVFLSVSLVFWGASTFLNNLYQSKPNTDYICPILVFGQKLTSHQLMMFVNFLGEGLFFAAYLIILGIEMLDFVVQRWKRFMDNSKGVN